MRVSSADQSAALSGVGYGDAESLFRSKPISEIRNVESNTRKQIDDKKEELRQLIGNRYRDLIDSADSILSMKSSCESIYSNVSSISDSILSLSSESPNLSLGFPKPNPNRAKIYGIACRVKYLVDTPENIWGCLDESMFLEAAARYVRARLVHQSLNSINSMDSEGDGKILSKQFPLLNHQWQIVESFRAQISQRSRERLMSVDKNTVGCLTVGAFADALAGVAVVDDFDAKLAFSLFLDSRKSWIMQKLNNCGPGGSVEGTDSDGSGVVSVLCEITKIILVTVAHVGELFLHVLNDKPLFFKMILESPPASQLFGGIPNPDEEVRLWTEFRNKLESAMVNLDREYIAKTCSGWLKGCRIEIINKINDKCLLNAIANGGELASAENMIRETMDSKDVLDGSLEWLKSVFGSNIELPWNRTRELVLEENIDLWDEIFEDAFVQRITVIIDSGFTELNSIVNVTGSVTAIGESSHDLIDFQAYMNRSTSTGSVWFADPNVKKSSLMGARVQFEDNDFDSCLNAYLGPEASRIREAVDSRCRSILEDLLRFLESPKSSLRLKDLAPYLQNRCHKSLSTILKDLKNELVQLRSALDNINKGVNSGRPASIVEKSLFIGRLLFAFQNHSKHIPVILGSPKSWANDSMVAGLEKLPLLKSSRLSTESPLSDVIGKQNTDGSRRQTSRAASALFGSDDYSSSKLEEVIKAMRDLSITAHGLWISWLVEELSAILTHDIKSDDGLSTSTSSSLKGWEEITVKQDGESSSELKISLPNTPSMYITSFLFRACGEVHRVGGHVLDRTVLQQFALRLLESVMGCYQEFFTSDGDRVSEKGILQMLLDLRFAADILSGGDSILNEGISKGSSTKYTFRRKQEQSISTTASRERLNQVLSQFWQKLDPIDWQTYEPYLWENVKQSYMRHAVLFGFFVQLNRMYTDTLQKLPSNSESNLMRCSTVPRFKYLPISGPVQSSRVAAKTPLRTSSDDIALRNSLKSLMNGDRSQKLDIDDGSGFGAATPFLKSFMQVGSRFGESTFKLGSISSSFGEILPMQAAGGFLSSLTTNRSDS